jgi:hypothetical protein
MVICLMMLADDDDGPLFAGLTIVHCKFLSNTIHLVVVVVVVIVLQPLCGNVDSNNTR